MRSQWIYVHTSFGVGVMGWEVVVVAICLGEAELHPTETDRIKQALNKALYRQLWHQK